MAITVGTKLGSYEVLSMLGKGGMGEVYRARDTKLGRDVAIKTIPETFASDPDRLGRFQREAQVLAALNHPHIAQIHGLEETGKESCIVMELVEGETLEEKLQKGPVPVPESLRIAKQIAEALEAAHEKGIVHRDLKPANVKITPDDQVKVLDFGLAKALEGSQSQSTLSNSPTLSMAATQAGVILGTAAYMSPEQAKGAPSTSRSDVFSFGCVLYEMLTGRQAFLGETAAETMASVLVRDPDLKALPQDLNPRLYDLLRRCVEKNPKLRWHAVGDLRAELETIAADPYRRPEAGRPAVVPAGIRERVAWITLAVVTVIALTTGTQTLWDARIAAEMRLDISTRSTADPLSFAISPDGRRVVFVAAPDTGAARLWVRSLDSVTAQPLAGTEGASFPFWSPDSRSIGFFAGAQLKRIDLGAGLPQTLTNAANGRGATWNSDGVIIFAPTNAGSLFRVAASGGEATPLAPIDAQQGLTSHRFPQFLPDGNRFLFFAVGSTDTLRGIYLASLNSSDAKRLMASDLPGVFMPPDWLLFVRPGGTLMARRLDLSREELTGEPVLVTDQVVSDEGLSVAGISTSNDGVIAYRGGGTGSRLLAWFDRSGKFLSALSEADENSLGGPELSPDGQRVVVHRTVQGNADIYLLDGKRAVRFTSNPGLDRFAIWSPDGKDIVFDSSRSGLRDLYRKPANGEGNERLLLPSPFDEAAYDWSPDGRHIIYRAVESQSGRDLWVLPLEEGKKPVPFLKTIFDEGQAQFSPDGRWVAYQSNEAGQYEIFIRPFPGPGGWWQVSTSGGIQPRWSPDGKHVFYISPDAKLMSVPITVQGTVVVPGTPIALFQTRIWGGGSNNNQRQQYDVAADGRFIMNVTTEESTSSPITLILNWNGGAER